MFLGGNVLIFGCAMQIELIISVSFYSDQSFHLRLYNADRIIHFSLFILFNPIAVAIQMHQVPIRASELI